MFKAKYYDKIYREKDYQKEVSFLKKHLIGETILDIGGGTGTRAVLLEREGFECLNIDPDEMMIRISKSKGIASVRSAIENPTLAIEGTIKGLFDNAIMVFDVFNFLQDPLKAFKNVHWYLKKRGRLIFDFWDYEKRLKGFSIKWQGLFTRISYKKWQGNDVRVYFWFPFKFFGEKHRLALRSQKTIQECLKETGFRIINTIKGESETTIIAEKI